MNVLLDYHGRISSDVYEGYRSVVAHEFHNGELSLGADPIINATLEKAIDHPFILARLEAHNQISYRRQRSHIRSSRTVFQTAWFIKRGGLRVIRSDGTVVTNAGWGAIYDSLAPMFVETITDDEGIHESFMAFIPMHLFRSKVGNLTNFNISFPLSSGQGRIADQIVSLMYDHGASVSRNVIEAIADSALVAIANCIVERCPPHLTRAEQRLADIERHILRDLADPNLSASAIADACHMSIRYLHYILKAGGHTLSSLLWNARLDQAREFMLAEPSERLSISDVAQMCGYKSVSHFRRQFRSRYGLSPKDYREKNMMCTDAHKEAA